MCLGGYKQFAILTCSLVLVGALQSSLLRPLMPFSILAFTLWMYFQKLSLSGHAEIKPNRKAITLKKTCEGLKTKMFF